MEDEKIINGNCWIVHFDILGFSNMVENFPVWFVQKEYIKARERGKRSNVKCKFKFFSDSFIFYTDDDSPDSFSCIEATSALFFQAMFRGRIPMRGCLNIGQFYSDEKNGIFFGPAHIEAYRLAEEQNWIGFVLSEKTREKLASFELVGFKSGYKKRYSEYEVPYNDEPYRRNLLAYNLILASTNPGFQNELWMALDSMKFNAIQMLLKENGNKNVDIEKCPEYRKIITKYENTEKFMFCVYPELEQRAKNRGKSEV